MTLLRSLAFTLLAPGFLVGFIPWLLARARPELVIDTRLLSVFALPAWISSAAILAWCAWTFATVAEVSPAHVEVPRRLIVVGPYRHVRNPMYLAQFLALIGHLLSTGSLLIGLYLVNYVICAWLLVVHFEERQLSQRFGDEFFNYKRQVPAWLPKFRCLRQI